MPSHTPGPWYAREYRHIPTHKHPGNSGVGVFSAATGIEVPITDLFGANRNDDARLIAAAPELLQALEECVHVVGTWGDDGEPTWLEQARAAIKKASG